jgi:hypothetical protein
MLFPLNVGNSMKGAKGRNHRSVTELLCRYIIRDGGKVLSDLTVPEMYTTIFPPVYRLLLCYIFTESVY